MPAALQRLARVCARELPLAACAQPQTKAALLWQCIRCMAWQALLKRAAHFEFGAGGAAAGCSASDVCNAIVTLRQVHAAPRRVLPACSYSE